MKYLIGILMILLGMNVYAAKEDNTCFIDTSTNVTATTTSTRVILASATRSCLFIANKHVSNIVYLSPVTSTTATDGIPIYPLTVFMPLTTPTNDFYVFTSNTSAPITIESGYYLR